MAMAVDNRNQQSHINLPGVYDGLRYQPVPQFTNPWVAQNASGATSSHMYAPSTVAPTSTLEAHQAQRPTTLPIPAYGLPVTASSLGAELISPSRSYGSQYSTAGAVAGPGPTAGYTASSASGYSMDYATNKSPITYQSTFERRSSHPLNSITTSAQRSSFGDAVDASRGMVALANSDMTPRNIYDVRNNSRSSTDSYGFPSTHSSHSSISSASTYPSSYGYNPSVAGSDVSDYSSASESVDLTSRTLPRPSNFPGTAPPPQSMMGQFSAKVSSNSQKKHKCKICDKRFTRPSSLQTHMYSHTGEKPFACEVEGCGRHFSVVSNLRRHRKVHKNEGHSDDHPSPEES